MNCFKGPPGWSLTTNSSDYDGDYSILCSDPNAEMTANLLSIEEYDFRLCFTNLQTGGIHFEISVDGCNSGNPGHSDGQDGCLKTIDEAYTCLAASSVPQESDNESIMLGYPYPNPVRGGGVSLDYVQIAAGPTTVSILDENGKILSRLRNSQGGGASRIYLETNSLPSGDYVCVVETGSKKLSRSFIVDRH